MFKILCESLISFVLLLCQFTIHAMDTTRHAALLDKRVFHTNFDSPQAKKHTHSLADGANSTGHSRTMTKITQRSSGQPRAARDTKQRTLVEYRTQLSQSHKRVSIGNGERCSGEGKRQSIVCIISSFFTHQKISQYPRLFFVNTIRPVPRK